MKLTPESTCGFFILMWWMPTSSEQKSLCFEGLGLTVMRQESSGCFCDVDQVFWRSGTRNGEAAHNQQIESITIETTVQTQGSHIASWPAQNRDALLCWAYRHEAVSTQAIWTGFLHLCFTFIVLTVILSAVQKYQQRHSSLQIV